MKDPICCAHCGGLANHRPLPDGSPCPTARAIGLLRAAADSYEAASRAAEERTGPQREDAVPEPVVSEETWTFPPKAERPS